MALIKCPECGQEISDKSKKCIHCGCPSPANVIKRNTERRKREEEKKRETLSKANGEEENLTAASNPLGNSNSKGKMLRIGKIESVLSKLKEKFYENKKRSVLVVAIIGVLLVVGIIGIVNSQSNQYEDSYIPTVPEVVPVVLYNHLSESYISDRYDIASTRYDIGTTERQADGSYDVKGTFSLYDDYGKISTTYYNEEFEMNVRLDGEKSYCKTTFGSGYY